MLTQRRREQALWCAEQVRQSRATGKPVPGQLQPWNSELVRELQLEVAVSSSRQESESDDTELEHDDWIGSSQAATILRWNIKQVQRRKHDLGGRKVAGKLVFRESAVRRYIEGLTCSS